MDHRVKGVSTFGPWTSPHIRSSCTWSSRPWARRSARTRLSSGRTQSIQDLQHLFIVVTPRNSTACSSTGHRHSRCDSTRLDISWLMFWKNFESQEQEVLSSTPTGLCNPGFKEWNNFQLPSTSSRHRICVSDHTIQSSSRLLSIERYKCGQWSSTVTEGWSVSSVCASNDSRCPFANSLVFVPKMPTRHLLGYQSLQQEASRHSTHACYKETEDRPRLSHTIRKDSSLNLSRLKCRMCLGSRLPVRKVDIIGKHGQNPILV